MKLRDNWDRVAAVWDEWATVFDGVDDPYARIAINAMPITVDWSILDIGCGPGVGTVQLAVRAGHDAHVTGIDVSPQMILYAERRAHAAVMRGEITPDAVSFRVADAGTADLGTGHDAVFSRFGTLFFADTHGGFTNLAEALRPGGWLSMVVWAEPENNPWMPLPTDAAAKVLETTVEPADPTEAGPFGFADRDATTELLGATGFDHVEVLEVTDPRRVHRGTERFWARAAVRLGPLGSTFDAADAPTQRDVVDAVVADLERHRDPGPSGDLLLPAHARIFVARKT